MILLVDDNEVHRGSTEALLRARGFAVRSCGDAASALAELRRARPAVLVLDLAMPGMCGRQLLEVLTAEGRLAGLRVIVTTALPDPLPELPPGVVCVLRKPFDIGELAAAVGGVAAARN